MSLPESNKAAARPRTETQSALTINDYANLFLQYRVWYVIGVIMAMALTFVVVKFVAVKYYRAESMFFINTRIPPEQGVGMVDAAIFQPRTNETYQTAVQMQIAERVLKSDDLLTSTILALKQGPAKYDLAEVLKIEEKDPERARRLLVNQLRKDLINVHQIESTGIIEFNAEMPEPVVAAAFVNEALNQLKREFISFNFGYFIRAKELYATDLKRLQEQQQQLALDLKKFNATHKFDASETVREQQREMEGRLNVFATQITALTARVQNLDLATRPEALEAAQPIKIINRAEVPLKKSRPQTILTTLLAGALYTFVYLTGLMLAGLYRVIRGSGVNV